MTTSKRIGITGILQESSRTTVGHYNITKNIYDGNRERVQVFIDDMQGENHSYGTMPEEKVDQFIRENTND